MGALKKVPPRLAGVEKKFEKKVGFVGSSHCLAGSKAHVFALLWAPGRLVRWTIYENRPLAWAPTSGGPCNLESRCQEPPSAERKGTIRARSPGGSTLSGSTLTLNPLRGRRRWFKNQNLQDFQNVPPQLGIPGCTRSEPRPADDSHAARTFWGAAPRSPANPLFSFRTGRF